MPTITESMNRLLWFRTDLRVHDNQTLCEAISGAPAGVAYVYIHHERADEAPLGPQRRRFLNESVHALKESLQKHGADLLCLAGDPLQILPDLCRRLKVTDVFHSRLTAHHELQQEHALAKILRDQQVRTHRFQTNTMVCDEDVDFAIYAPMSFSKLRRFIELSWPIRPPLEVPEKFPPALTVDDPQWQPEITASAPHRGQNFQGGEAAGLTRVHEYFWMGDNLKNYQDTRNGLLRRDDSSKFSPWMNLGCLSARTLYQEVRRYELQRASNSSTLWFLYELLWRDHFHFLAKHRGHLLFTDLPEAQGEQDEKRFEQWRLGQTESPFINAAMNELRTTGWLSNRMRQNAASYLIYDLKIDWRWGARWFETQLVDYDPCSNWGNWAYIAGADHSRKPHQFDVRQQSERYDVNQSYQKYYSSVKES